jgi:hypothetical protein
MIIDTIEYSNHSGFFSSIEMLDGKQITDNSRQFLMSWKASREAQLTREKSKADFNDPTGVSFTHGGKFKFKLMIFEISIEDLYMISFCLSPNYSFRGHASAINDSTSNVRSVPLNLPPEDEYI